MATYKYQVVLGYRNMNTKTYAINLGTKPDSHTTAKAMVKAINANESGQYDAFYQTFVEPESASPVTTIAALRYVEENEEVVYNG